VLSLRAVTAKAQELGTHPFIGIALVSLCMSVLENIAMAYLGRLQYPDNKESHQLFAKIEPMHFS
jgi:hypothetical protein